MTQSMGVLFGLLDGAGTCMKCGIRLALSGESYFVPSFAELHARYHLRRDVLASCCPSHVA